MALQDNIRQDLRCAHGFRKLAKPTEPTCSVCVAEEVDLVEDLVKRNPPMLSIWR